MKLPWSKKYPYTKHSAPITNSILRNGKVGSANAAGCNSGGLRVAFAHVIRRDIAPSGDDASAGSFGDRDGRSATPGRRRRRNMEVANDVAPSIDGAGRSATPGRRRTDGERKKLEPEGELSRYQQRRSRTNNNAPGRTRRGWTDGSDLDSSVLSEDLDADEPRPRGPAARRGSGRPRMERRGSLSSIASSSSFDTDKKERSRKSRTERRCSTTAPSPVSEADKRNSPRRPRMERRRSGLSSIHSNSSLDTDTKERSRKSRDERRSSTSDAAAPSSVAGSSSRGVERQRRSANPRRARRGSSGLASSKSSRSSAGSSGSNTSASKPRSEGSSDTIASLAEKPHRLGDLPPEKIASGYGKWESNETIDTASITDASEDQRLPRPQGGERATLSRLLDEKIAEARERTKLSRMLDEKIEAKLRRQKEAQWDASKDIEHFYENYAKQHNS